jgi:hypothetical protein
VHPGPGAPRDDTHVTREPILFWFKTTLFCVFDNGWTNNDSVLFKCLGWTWLGPQRVFYST